MSTDDNWILYDGDCVFCQNYTQFLKLKDSVGPVRIINARDETPERKVVEDLGFDLDEGMAFFLNGQVHHGGECVYILATLTQTNGLLNRVNYWVFKSKTRTQFLYPALRFGRNITLKLRGKDKISQSDYQ